MTIAECIAQRLGSRAVSMLLIITCLLSACQGKVAPTPAASPTQAAVTALPSPTVLPLTRTPIPSPTMTLTPTAVPTQAALTAGGPWLLYQRIAQYPEGGYFEALFVANADGSGSQMINGAGCESAAPLAMTADPANRLVELDGHFILVNLDQGTAQSLAPDCRTKLTGSAERALLATIDRAAAELRVYELPQGRLRGAFPITACAAGGAACSFDRDSGSWIAEWDPAGRSLVFPVILDGAQSDLYLYDAQTNATRLLARIPGRVSRMWWSPGGSNLLLGLSASGDFFLESFWAVAAAGGNARQVSAEGQYLSDVELLDWLDENRFLFYSGSLQYVVSVGASNLRMLDIRTRQETTLLGDGFLRADLDRQAGVVGMIVAVYNSQYEDGAYLVPAAQPTPQKIAPVETAGIYNTYWDEGLRLFVSEDPCPDGQPGLRAFDSQGQWHCAPAAKPAESSLAAEAPSPDGQWRALLKADGLWVEKAGRPAGGPAVHVHDAPPTQVIWRPDSGGFFFIAGWGLYYVSLPDRSVRALGDPDALGNASRWASTQLEYQWLENGSTP